MTKNLFAFFFFLIIGNVLLTCYVVSDNCLGHYPYLPVAEEDLVEAVVYESSSDKPRTVKLVKEAAKAIQLLMEAAEVDGITLEPISGFRTISRQRYLFMRELSRRRRDEARELVAPPGYSEHHTGLAVDFAYKKKGVHYISPQFLDTPGFEWLMQNASRFGFELSFPMNNQIGVRFEPWHWRYIGSPHLAARFRKGFIGRSFESLQIFLSGQYMCSKYR